MQVKGDYGEIIHILLMSITLANLSVEATKLILFVLMQTGEDFSEERV